MASSFFLVLCALSLLSCAVNASDLLIYAPTFEEGYSEVVKFDMGTNETVAIFKYDIGKLNPGGGATGLAVVGNTIIWGDSTTGTVQSVDLSGASHRVLVANLTEPQGLTYDKQSGLVYFIDNSAPQRVFSMTSSGSKLTQLPLDELRGGCGVAVHDGVLYVGTDIGLVSANLRDDSPTFTMLISSVKYVQGIVVSKHSDDSVPTLFFTSFYAGGNGGYALYSAALDGTAVTGVAERPGDFATFMLTANWKTNSLYWIRGSDTPYMTELKYADSTSVGQSRTLLATVKGSAYGIAVV